MTDGNGDGNGTDPGQNAEHDLAFDEIYNNIFGEHLFHDRRTEGRRTVGYYPTPPGNNAGN